MEATMHDVVSVTIGATHKLEGSGSYTRELVITRRSGERMNVTMFGDCAHELRVIELDETYPSHIRAA